MIHVLYTFSVFRQASSSSSSFSGLQPGSSEALFSMHDYKIVSRERRLQGGNKRTRRVSPRLPPLLRATTSIRASPPPPPSYGSDHPPASRQNFELRRPVWRKESPNFKRQSFLNMPFAFDFPHVFLNMLGLAKRCR